MATAVRFLWLCSLTRFSVHRFAAILSLLGLLSLSGCEKYELDTKMEELCQEDGGMKVYETVTLASNMFDHFGRVKSVPKEIGGSYVSIIADSYMASSEMKKIKEGDPLKGQTSLARIHTKITRIADGAVLAEGISYLRAGGDWVPLGHFSQKACPDTPIDLISHTFFKTRKGAE